MAEQTEEYGGPGKWVSYQAALKGVPGQECTEYTFFLFYHTRMKPI